MTEDTSIPLWVMEDLRKPQSKLELQAIYDSLLHQAQQPEHTKDTAIYLNLKLVCIMLLFCNLSSQQQTALSATLDHASQCLQRLLEKNDDDLDEDAVQVTLEHGRYRWRQTCVLSGLDPNVLEEEEACLVAMAITPIPGES